MKCPGQDRRYWKGDAAFEVPCPQCGSLVELFKDEGMGRCPRCSHRFSNPGADFGCAQWCSLANECLGYTPQRQSTAAEKPLAARLIHAVEEALAHDRAQFARALKVFRYAQDLAAKEGGDPRIVIAAALLLGIDSGRAGCNTAATDQQTAAASLPQSRGVLQRSGVDEETSERVCRIVDGLRTGDEVDTVEFRIVADAARLAALSQQHPRDNPDEPAADLVLAGLRTAAGKQKALSLLQSQGP